MAVIYSNFAPVPYVLENSDLGNVLGLALRLVNKATEASLTSEDQRVCFVATTSSLTLFALISGKYFWTHKNLMSSICKSSTKQQLADIRSEPPFVF